MIERRVERSEITRWLLARAEAEGVQVEVLFRSGSDKKRVTATEAIIGADGINSNVGRAAAICQPPSGWDPDVTQV